MACVMHACERMQRMEREMERKESVLTCMHADARPLSLTTSSPTLSSNAPGVCPYVNANLSPQ